MLGFNNNKFEDKKNSNTIPFSFTSTNCVQLCRK